MWKFASGVVHIHCVEVVECVCVCVRTHEAGGDLVERRLNGGRHHRGARHWGVRTVHSNGAAAPRDQGSSECEGI